MPLASEHIEVSCDHGTATLWLRFPGKPVNALDADRLAMLDQVLTTIASNPFIKILVIRSGMPSGFCEGVHPRVLEHFRRCPTNAAAFARMGQAVFDRLATLPVPSVAFIDGVCLDAGLELALACDYRLALASITVPLGFPSRQTLFGGGPRLRALMGQSAERLLQSGRLFSAREAQRFGLVDVAFCERRAKIELRSFLDGLEVRPRKPQRRGPLAGFATERRRFARTPQSFTRPHRVICLPPRWQSDIKAIPFKNIGIIGDSSRLRLLAADLAVIGQQVLTFDLDPQPRIAELLARGFLTPLEAEDAKKRIRSATSLYEFVETDLTIVARREQAMHLAHLLGPGSLIVTQQSDAQGFCGVPYPQRIVTLDDWWESPTDVHIPDLEKVANKSSPSAPSQSVVAA